MKKSVVIRAPLLSISGYGVHSRQIFRWLNQRADLQVTSQVVKWGHTSWMINGKMENGLVEEVMKKSGPGPSDSKFDISFQVQLPDEWDPSLASINVGVSAVVETSSCNPKWVESVNKMSAVIIPSEFSKRCLLNSGNIQVPIYVVPEAFIDEIEDDSLLPLPFNVDTAFNFLILGQVTGDNQANDRKNLFNTLKWICEVFHDDPDVGIILKTNQGRGTKIDRMLSRKLVESVISQTRQGPYPKIHFLHGNMSAKEVASLYRRDDIKCLVSLTRGEGFGLPMLEAAASGVPVMITNWSGHLDFLNLGKFIPIDFKIIPIDGSRVDNRIFMPGTMWADPIEADFKDKILKFRKKPHLPKQWAESLKEKVREKFSHKAIFREYDNVFEKL